MSSRAATHFRRPAWSSGYPARRHRDASVAVISALTAPLLILALGLGIDVSYWMAARLELQRMADLAAMAGAATYASKNQTTSAVITAANVAELNGFPPSASRTDSANPLSESDLGWSGTFASNSGAQLVTVSLQRQVATFFSSAWLGAAPVISVKATAAVQPRPGVGQACVLALQGYATGVTTSDDLIVDGGVNLTLSGCDLRGDASMQFNGNPTINVANVIASGSITAKLCTATPSSCQQQQPQVPDPFAAKYSSLLTSPSLAGGQTSTTVITGQTVSVTVLGTGEYYVQGGLTFGGNSQITVQPGTYYVQGDINFNGGSNVFASGVTLISLGGNINVGSDTTLTLTAPTTGASVGLIFATTGQLNFNGNATATMQGAIYAPNGQVTFDGNPSPTDPCLTIVASTVTFNGSSSLSNAGCAGMGVPGIPDQPEVARLIQ